MPGCDKERILVVDDESAIRDLFDFIVSISFPGKKVDKACNGLEAVRLFQEHRQGLILMDLRMPAMDGIQAFQAIREFCEKESTRLPPVVFCTGFAPGEVVCEIVGDGSYHALIRKPVRSDDIIALLKAKLALAT